MVSLKDIEFSYRKHELPALTRITAEIGPGVHLLAGEKGAGKTTLLHLIAGIRKPSSGECLINDEAASSDSPSKMARTFMLEENMFFPGPNIRSFAKRHSKFYPNFSQERFEENLHEFGLTGYEAFKSQSLGNRKKAQLSYVLALGVDVILLDEPTNALDIQSKEVLRRLLAGTLRDDQTVIVATHTVSELENVFDGAIMITRSRLLFAGTDEAVSHRLAFRVTRMPLDSALYSEIQVGRVLGIYHAIEEEGLTRTDWRLLYSALHSPQRDDILIALASLNKH